MYLKDSDDERNQYRRGSSTRFPPDTFYDETNVRMKKFAESLMRQRQIRDQERTRQERRSHSKERKSSSPGRHEKRNKSIERRLETELKDELRLREQGAYSLPVIYNMSSDKSTSEIGSSPEKLRAGKKKRSKLRKSSSMTEISEVPRDTDFSKRSASNTQLPMPTKPCQESGSNWGFGRATEGFLGFGLSLSSSKLSTVGGLCSGTMCPKKKILQKRFFLFLIIW